jgi:ABC-2 type transport system ATP-binding protein
VRDADRADDHVPVRARGLAKRYGDLLAVDHIDLEVRPGEVYGFLGPNGAGKTTTLRMLLGLIVPSGGWIQLFGRDPMREGARALDSVAGFVEAPRFYPYLSGRKNLELLAALDGGGARARIEEVLELVELTYAAHKRAGSYSHGMGQRLGIAAALLRRPRLLILDEPATGLDPAGIRDMRELVRRLAGEGITVLLSSHQLADVQEVCERVAIIRAGRIVYEGPLAETDASTVRGYGMRTTDNARALPIARTHPGIAEADAADGGDLRFRACERDVGALTLALGQQSIGVLALAPLLPSLEDRFFELTEGEDGTRAAAAVAT